MNKVAALDCASPQAPAASAPIRVFAACGDTLFRRGVAAVVADEDGFAWAGEAATAEQALALAIQAQPDVVLIDAELPGLDGLQTLRTLHPLLPRSRFAVLIARLDPDRARDAVAAGAACVLTRSAGQQEITTALQAVHRGVWAHPPAVTRALLTPRATPAPTVHLTPRERDLLQLMAQGLNNNDIARRLAIAMPTVKFHVSHIMSKLGAENRTAAVLTALRHKLVDLDSASVEPLADATD